MRFDLVFDREEYDFVLQWIHDSWPQFRQDRRTNSNVPPWFFTDRWPISVKRRQAMRAMWRKA
jgi:hypothetical protein